MSASATLVLLLACASRLPTALRSTPPETETPQVASEPTWATLVGSDPLLRRPPTTLPWPADPTYEPVLAFADTAAHPQPQPADWRALERSHPGTIAVPLARGALLADLEALLGSGIRPADAPRIASLLVPVVELDRVSPSDVRPPLAWAGVAGQEPGPAELLHLAERQVLLGWLDGPGLPLAEVAAAMKPGIHDRLISSPTGALLIARGLGRRDATAGQRGADSLRQATTLALVLAAAQTDREQEVARQRLLEANRALVGAEEAETVERDRAIRLLLARAREDLTADASETRSTGLALVAATAERVRGHCPDLPCGGLTRASALARLDPWGADAVAQASLWRVILARQALVGLELNLERPTFHARLLDVVEVVLGEEVEAVPLSLLRQGSPSPTTWLALTRSAGAPDATDTTHGLKAIRDIVVRRCDHALAQAISEEDRALVEKIRTRATTPLSPPAPAKSAPP